MFYYSFCQKIRSLIFFLPYLGRNPSQTLLVWLCLYCDIALCILNWIACGKAESQSCSTAPHWSNRIIAGPYIRLYEIKQLFNNKNIGDGLINGLIICLKWVQQFNESCIRVWVIMSVKNALHSHTHLNTCLACLFRAMNPLTHLTPDRTIWACVYGFQPQGRS